MVGRAASVVSPFYSILLAFMQSNKLIILISLYYSVVLIVLVFRLIPRSAHIVVEGGGAEQPCPVNWPPVSPDSQNDSEPIKIISVPHATSPSLRNSDSTSTILISKNNYLAFTSTKNLFFFKSHHGKKVVISSITFVSFSHLPLEVCEVIFVLL